MIQIGELFLETAENFAGMLEMSPGVIARLCREGVLPSCRIGGKWFVDPTRIGEVLMKQVTNHELRKIANTAKNTAHRLKHREVHPERDAAREAVYKALRSGALRREPCEVCGIVASVEAHHDDYAKALEVRWLCRKHHLWLHREQLKKENNNDQS